MDTKIIKTTLLFSVLAIAIFSKSCYYDKAELLVLDSACDTSSVTFNATILPIIQANCQGCHSGGAPSAGISLTNYAEVKASAESGSLMGTINHASGYSAMPKGGNKLSDCDIAKLNIWINNGMTQN